MENRKSTFHTSQFSMELPKYKLQNATLCTSMEDSGYGSSHPFELLILVSLSVIKSLSKFFIVVPNNSP